MEVPTEREALLMTATAATIVPTPALGGRIRPLPFSRDRKVAEGVIFTPAR
jgi:hypothetical protein